jgi:hypothetical protein
MRSLGEIGAIREIAAKSTDDLNIARGRYPITIPFSRSLGGLIWRNGNKIEVFSAGCS